jgi:hypothetical protein
MAATSGLALTSFSPAEKREESCDPASGGEPKRRRPCGGGCVGGADEEEARVLGRGVSIHGRCIAIMDG